MAKDDKKFLCFAHHKIVLDGICEKLDATKYRYDKFWNENFILKSKYLIKNLKKMHQK